MGLFYKYWHLGNYAEANNFAGEAEVTDPALCITGGPWDYNPYESDPLQPERIFEFHGGIATYIKNGLQHTSHPISINYTGEHDVDGMNAGASDLSYLLSPVDVYSWDSYTEGLSYNSAGIRNELIQLRTTFGFSKPSLTAEIGIAFPDGLCDNEAEWIRTAWVSPFTGVAAASMNWTLQHYLGYGVYEQLGNVSNFMEGVNLSECGAWVPYYELHDDKLAEIVYLKSQCSDISAMGVIVNRTWNHYTAETDPGSACKYISEELDDSPDLMTPTDLYYSGGLFGIPAGFELENMGFLKTYTIEWYNALTMTSLGTTAKTSGIFGDLRIDFPSTLFATETGSIFAFRIYRPGQQFAPLYFDIDELYVEEESQAEWDQLTESAEIESEFKHELYLSPNPARSSVSVSVSDLLIGGMISIMDSYGNVVHTTNITKEQFNIDLTDFQPGIYIVIVNYGNDLITEKLVVN